jgi:hypothetical protein
MKNEARLQPKYISKPKQLLPEFQSRPFENRGTHFILHSSFFIFCRCVQTRTEASGRIKNLKLRMKGVYGCENQTKLSEWLTEIQSMPFDNQGTHFILHSSFFIFHFSFYLIPFRN